eukprot:TRINITY_DN25635_c0_g1_i1.p1 TRINITY_DN25635_c0_g1~~TRINITY_DN25635_c0_g1_i1.p1  ORF type:complete len:132 (-),score=54.05 TRINITY_DN25635_c0_g1_i1:150-545(-)
MAKMMLKMMNPMGSMPSMPKVGGGDDDLSREEKIEQEKVKKEEMIRAEKERKTRYLKEREGRDTERDQMRDKYKIQKPVREEEEESEDEDDGFGSKKPVEEKDTMAKAKNVAVDKLQDATNMVSSLFSFRR